MEENRRREIFEEQIKPAILERAVELKESRSTYDRDESVRLSKIVFREMDDLSSLEFAAETSRIAGWGVSYFSCLSEAYGRTKDEKYVEEMKTYFKEHKHCELAVNLFEVTGDKNYLISGIKHGKKIDYNFDWPKISFREELGGMYALLANHTQDPSWIKNMMKFLKYYEKKFKNPKNHYADRWDILLDEVGEVMAGAINKIEDSEVKEELVAKLEEFIDGRVLTGLDKSGLEALFIHTEKTRYLKVLEEYFGIDSNTKRLQYGSGPKEPDDIFESREYFYRLTGNKAYLEGGAKDLVKFKEFESALEFLVKHDSVLSAQTNT